MDISGFLKENKESLKDLKEDDINEILEDYEIDNINDPKQKIRFFKQVENTRKRLKIEEEKQKLKTEVEEEKLKLNTKMEEENQKLKTKMEEENQKLKTEVEQKLKTKMEEEKQKLKKEVEEENQKLKTKMEEENQILMTEVEQKLKKEVEEENQKLKTKMEEENQKLMTEVEQKLKTKMEEEKQKLKKEVEEENQKLKTKMEEENQKLKTEVEQKLKKEVEEENQKLMTKMEEENQKLKTKMEENQKSMTEVEKENQKLKTKMEGHQKLKTEAEDLKKSIFSKPLTKKGDLKGTTSYSELFKIKNSLNLIEENCQFKNWNIPSGIELEQVINLDDCNQESKMQSKLDEYFKDFNKKRKLIITNGTKIKIDNTISNKYCDYFINQKGFPFEPYWIHMVGDIKNGSITSETNMGQVLKYIDIIVEKSNHHVLKRPMFGFLMNKTKMKFVKYDIEGNKYYITIDYDLSIGFQYLSNIMYYLEQFIRNIPNSLKTILKNNTNDSVEYYYGLTSSVFIVNKEFVYKWFNDPYYFQNEVKYLTFVDGIEGTPSIKQQNQTENWIQISPRGQLIKNLKGKPIDISFYTKSVEILKKIHQREVIHRDIRLSNLLMNSGGDPLLVDFGFANFTENEEPYQGTINTASNRIYDILINNKTNYAFPVVESDDLESLVKVYMMENEKVQAQNKNYEELKNEFIKFDKTKNTTTTLNNSQNHTNINKNTIANTTTTSYTNTIETSTTNTNTNTTTSDTNTNTSTTSTTNTNTTTSNTITALSIPPFMGYEPITNYAQLIAGNHYKMFYLDSWQEADLITLPQPKRNIPSLYCFKVGTKTGGGINVKKTSDEIKGGILYMKKEMYNTLFKN
ncbi:hypothetical protein ACTFIW_005606 [Dictyostelium discoideum]